MFMAVNLAKAYMIDTMHPYAPCDIARLFTDEMNFLTPKLDLISTAPNYNRNYSFSLLPDAFLFVSTVFLYTKYRS